MDHKKRSKFLIGMLDRVFSTFLYTKQFINNSVKEIYLREKVPVNKTFFVSSAFITNSAFFVF